MVINPLLFSICESTRSYDHSPDRKSGTSIPVNPCVKGMVFPGYGNPNPGPVPGHTRDPILTVLPIPLAFLNHSCCSLTTFGVSPVGGTPYERLRTFAHTYERLRTAATVSAKGALCANHCQTFRCTIQPTSIVLSPSSQSTPLRRRLS